MSNILLSEHERERFPTWLEYEAATAGGIIEHLALKATAAEAVKEHGELLQAAGLAA